VTKQAEIDYLRKLGGEGLRHAAGKPFTDDHVGEHLLGLGAILSLLPPPPLRVLDLGCGSGWTSWFLAKRGYEVLGVDISEDFIRLAERERAGVPNLNFRVMDYEAMAFDGEFEAALFFDALHHAEDEGLALEKAWRALRPGGLCLCLEPGRGHAKAGTTVEAAAKFGVTEKDLPPAKIIRLGKRAGFRTFEVFPGPGFLSHGIFRPAWAPDSRTSFRPRFLRDAAKFVRLLARKRDAGLVLLVK